MKKFFSLVLALVMALSLTTVAWGADVTVSTAEELKNALDSTHANYVGENGTITFGDDITVDTVGTTNVAGNYITYALSVPAGVTINGAGHTLTVTGVDNKATDNNSNKKCAIFATNGITVNDLTIDGGSRGIFIHSKTGEAITKDVVFDNVIIMNSARPFNVSGSCAAGVKLTVSDSVLAGKVSYTVFDSATFTNCEFVANGGVKGDIVEMRSATDFDNCVFTGFDVALDPAANPNTVVSMKDCVYDGEAVTEANKATLFGDALAAKTTATYVSSAYDEFDTKDAKTMAVKGTKALKLVAAKAAYIDSTTGAFVPGYVKHYVDEYGTTYVPCTSDVEGALYMYYKGTTSVYDIVVDADPNYKTYGTAFGNFGTACGQLDNRADTTAKYYTYVDADGVSYLVKGAVASATQLMVDGKLVPVVDTDLSAQLNGHKWVVTKNAKNEITAAKCSLCGLNASWTLNMAAIPTGAEFEAAPGGGYLYWNAAPVASEKPVVESAQTFDAGIAMYVGMSVMAACGSAVVIGKKKD